MICKPLDTGSIARGDTQFDYQQEVPQKSFFILVLSFKRRNAGAFAAGVVVGSAPTA